MSSLVDSSDTIQFPRGSQSFTSVANLHEYEPIPDNRRDNKKTTIEKLYTRAVQLYVKYNRRSSLHKFLNVILSTLIIIIGTLIFTISVYSFGSDGSTYSGIVAISGMFITICQSMKSVFKFQDRSVMYKTCSLESLTISRSALDLYNIDNHNVVTQKLNKYHRRLDEIEIRAYDNSVVNFETSRSQSRKIVNTIYSDQDNSRLMTLVSST